MDVYEEGIIKFFSEFIKNVLTVDIPLDKHNSIGIESGEDTNAHMDGTTLSVGVLFNSTPIKKTWLEQEHSKMFGTLLRNEVDRRLVVSRESVLENLRWISNGPNKNVLKYESYAINGYTVGIVSKAATILGNYTLGCKSFLDRGWMDSRAWDSLKFVQGYLR
uniref:Uncharacterized protein n=1 Tax=Lactuca sativa TaxID=4236 RepID=A0A9R1XP39_LACSA|nr:hypothetical protein LSAT_V11C400210670 [Lactuca sativa]